MASSRLSYLCRIGRSLTLIMNPSASLPWIRSSLPSCVLIVLIGSNFSTAGRCISCFAFCKSFRCCILDDHIWCHRFDILYFGMVDVLLGFGRVGCKVEMESMLVELSTVLHISLVWCLLCWPHLLLTQKWGLLGGGLG